MPVSIRFIPHNFDQIAARYRRAGGEFRAALDASFLQLAPPFMDAAVELIKGATPVVTGKLRDSTDHANVHVGGGSLHFDVVAPAESEPNMDGSGGGFLYVKAVIGGRGPVFPVTKKALAGPGFGPVHSAGPAAAHDYPSEVMGGIGDAAETFAHEVVAATFRVLGL